MSVIANIPPPRRWLVEMGTNDDGDETAEIVEVTGTEDPCYLVGVEDPWLGCTLAELEKYATEGEYSPCTVSVVLQIAKIKSEIEKP